MDAYEIIYKKREGKTLSKREIEYFIEGYTAGDIPDYQVAAWAMAVFFQGLDHQEAAYLTEVMVESGEKITPAPGMGGAELRANSGQTIVDKHSTGGVGDTTTLVLVPLVSAAGLPVAKMSGRGLGHTGGTIDKLESIPGFRVELTGQEFRENVKEIGAAVAAQTSRLAPADKKLYALRDVTATVDSIPLIASSIMSKKIAGGAAAVVLDVKLGSGAFMKTQERARRLAELMVAIGSKMGIKCNALLTDMNQPLGLSIGNSLEVIEAVETLKGQGPEDLEKLCLALGAHMLVLGGKVNSPSEGQQLLKQKIKSGAALKQLAQIIEAQQGNSQVISDYSLLPRAQNKLDITADKTGFVAEVDSFVFGRLAVKLGAGRSKKDEELDYAAGIKLNKKIGDRIYEGELLATLYYNKDINGQQLRESLSKAVSISEEKPQKNDLIYETIT